MEHFTSDRHMPILFYDKSTFNDDSSRLDTSQITSMMIIFCDTYTFNGDIHAWDTSKFTNMNI